MGARLTRGDWAVFGCTISPGLAASDVEGEEPAELITGWPRRRTEILALTRPNVPRTCGN
jgi:hypothetical protein